MDPHSNCLFITYVEKEGPFLKVWGQTDKNTSLYIEQVLHNFTPQFDNGFFIPVPEALQLGILCCAKYKDNKYYRAKVTSLDYIQNRYVEVCFLDYGNKDMVPILNIRSLDGFDTAFLSIPPQAAGFLLAEAVCPRGEWDDAAFEEISKEVRYEEVNFSIVAQVAKHYLVRLFVGVNDLAMVLISRGLMRPTSLNTQEAVLLSMMPRGPQPPAPAQQNIVTYKAFTLEPGSQYEIYVSYVTDGPCNFSVQLKQSEEIFGKLMKEINSMPLTPLEGVPLPGTVCLARCVEDGHICRAVVTSEVDGQYKVFYVDFGNYEVISIDSLYEIPFKYVIPKVMAIRFALAGVEKSTVTLEMQCAFKQFVDNRLIRMKVMPLTTRTSLPRCELWDPQTQTSALDVVNRAATAGYPEHVTLNRGFSQSVKVSYVFSCNKFYVQLKSKQEKLMKLMLDIQVLCRNAEPVLNNKVKVGLPCYALFEGDQQWYRSQIVDVLSSGHVKVYYVDYGNEEEVPTGHLRTIEGREMTILRPQAIECCLNGYQNMEPDIERDNLLEELILEKDFTMRIVEMQGKKALIELIDASNYNVASLLLDKIAVKRSQVSPMLVQAGNKIEHRKTSTPIGTPTKPDWKQERNKNNDLNDLSDSSSWRNTNKGFNISDERNKSDNDSSNSPSFSKFDRNKKPIGDGDSWKQNRSFDRNQDRFKDNNKNNWNNEETKNDRWGDAGENTAKKESNGWDNGQENRNKNWNDRDNKRSPHSRKDDWGNTDETERRDRNENRRNFNKDNDWSGNKRGENNWGNRDEKRGRDNFKNKEEWGGNKTENGSWGNKEKKNDWGGDNAENGSWGNREERRGRDFKTKGDEWGDNKSEGRRGRDFKGNKSENEWGNKEERKGRDNFKPRNRSDDGDNWNNEGGLQKKPNFRREKSDTWNRSDERKRPDFRREKSELSSSGSEKSFRKGKDFRNKRFDKPANIEVPNPAPDSAEYSRSIVENTEAQVTITWFHNPSYFYCQLQNSQSDFKQLMLNIQQEYKNKTTASTATVGAPIIGLFPEDNVLYRAKVLEVVGAKFKVFYVDYGNISVIDKIWPIEMRFMELPAQAICCKLTGIEPLGQTWNETENYGQYFDKTQFLCKFFATDGDKVAVSLIYDNVDVASLLVKDNLAKTVLPAIEPELPLLIGQQFRAMLTSFNSLSDFILTLQNGVLLNCSIFNVGVSTETWEDNLKQKLGLILLVYVDDLKDDRLEVTLYDESGSKIKLIDRDEEAYETVEILCPYLILSSALSGEITHVEDKTVFIQPLECQQTVQYLLNTAFEYYENMAVENPIEPTENFVYCVKGSDANWYRGRIKKISEGKVTVQYIDYGNCEEVELSALRELTADLMEIGILCVPVTVANATEDLIYSCVNVQLTFTENGLEATLHEEVETVPTTEPQPQPVEVVPTETAQGTRVVLSHTDSPSDFYLQLYESIPSIEALQATLQTEIPQMPDMENPVIGVLCAAPYSLDQQWYRAQVLDADSDITTVRFVDYGNTDVLDNASTRVKTLPPHLLSLEVHATRSRLKIKPVDNEWTSDATERFEQLCDVESLTVQFVSQDEKTNCVELFTNGIKVSDVLVQEKLAVPDETETSSFGFVSHFNSPSEFWIQLENCVEELEYIAEQLSAAESFPELEDLAPGTLCAAMFPDDQMWYRARILSNTVAGIEVLFVDYGNSCTSCSLRELPEDLVMLAPLAQKCSLKKPEGLTCWGPEMTRKFGEISADGQTTFNVQKLSTGETALVQLMLDGVDLTTLLLPQTEDVTVKNCTSLDEIVLEKNGEELGNRFKLERLPDVAWGEESVKKFQELSNGTVFQAEFVSEDTVRLYLGLNDIRLELNGTKTTPISSPMKIRSEKSTHSDQLGDDNMIKSLVEEFVESITNQQDSIHFVTDLVAHIVDTAINSSDHNTKFVKNLVNGMLDNITNASQTNTETSEQVSQDLLTEIIQESAEIAYYNQIENADSPTNSQLLDSFKLEDDSVTESSTISEDILEEKEKSDAEAENKTVDAENSAIEESTIAGKNKDSQTLSEENAEVEKKSVDKPSVTETIPEVPEEKVDLEKKSIDETELDAHSTEPKSDSGKEVDIKESLCSGNEEKAENTKPEDTQECETKEETKVDASADIKENKESGEAEQKNKTDAGDASADKNE